MDPLFYVKYVWPIVKPFTHRSKRCNNCISSSEYEVIENGLCNSCRIAVKQNVKEPTWTNADLDLFISKYQNNPGMYDATLLLSGGKDSAYILDKILKLYPDFKILCLFVENGFTSAAATNNIKYTTKKLNIDLFIINSSVNEFKCQLRSAFLSLKGTDRGCYGVIDNTDGSLIFKTCQEVTKNLGIPVMISGLSWVQLELIIGIKTFYHEVDGVVQLYPLAIFREGEQEIRKYVQDKELLLPGTDDPLTSNSDLIPAMLVADIKRFGYSSFEPEFSQLIREGKSSRKVWLPLFESLNYLVRRGHLDGEFKRILSRLDLTPNEVI